MYTEEFAPYKELVCAVMAQAAYDYMALYRVHLSDPSVPVSTAQIEREKELLILEDFFSTSIIPQICGIDGVHAVHILRDRVKSEPVRNFKATDLKYLTSQSKRGRKKKVS